MSSPTASAEVIPLNDGPKAAVARDASALRRVPTLDEVPVPRASSRRAEVVVYHGIGQHASYPTGRSRSVSPRGDQAPIEGLQLFTKEADPGQIYARVLILDPGSSVPREALITPLIGVSEVQRRELDSNARLEELVERANVEISRFFEGNGPIDGEMKMRAFGDYVKRTDSLGFLFSNLVNKNKGAPFDLFSAYFAPGGAMAGVGVFVNTWL